MDRKNSQDNKGKSAATQQHFIFTPRKYRPLSLPLIHCNSTEERWHKWFAENYLVHHLSYECLYIYTPPPPPPSSFKPGNEPYSLLPPSLFNKCHKSQLTSWNTVDRLLAQGSGNVLKIIIKNQSIHSTVTIFWSSKILYSVNTVNLSFVSICVFVYNWCIMRSIHKAILPQWEGRQLSSIWSEGVITTRVVGWERSCHDHTQCPVRLSNGTSFDFNRSKCIPPSTSLKKQQQLWQAEQKPQRQNNFIMDHIIPMIHTFPSS